MSVLNVKRECWKWYSSFYSNFHRWYLFIRLPVLFLVLTCVNMLLQSKQNSEILSTKVFECFLFTESLFVICYWFYLKKTWIYSQWISKLSYYLNRRVQIEQDKSFPSRLGLFRLMRNQKKKIDGKNPNKIDLDWIYENQF